MRISIITRLGELEIEVVQHLREHESHLCIGQTSFPSASHGIVYDGSFLRTYFFPKQARGTTMNGCKASRLSLANSGGALDSQRSGAKTSGWAKLGSYRYAA